MKLIDSGRKRDKTKKSNLRNIHGRDWEHITPPYSTVNKAMKIIGEDLIQKCSSTANLSMRILKHSIPRLMNTPSPTKSTFCKHLTPHERKKFELNIQKCIILSTSIQYSIIRCIICRFIIHQRESYLNVTNILSALRKDTACMHVFL